jgi:hypothetical protein
MTTLEASAFYRFTFHIRNECLMLNSVPAGGATFRCGGIPSLGTGPGRGLGRRGGRKSQRRHNYSQVFK